MRKATLAVLGAFAMTAPVAAPAAPPSDTTVAPSAQEDDDEFPWGLLGLLGLAGLLGLSRRDDRAHVDRRTTGTGTRM